LREKSGIESMTFSGSHVLTVFVLRPIKKTDLELLKLYCWK